MKDSNRDIMAFIRGRVVPTGRSRHGFVRGYRNVILFMVIITCICLFIIMPSIGFWRSILVNINILTLFVYGYDKRQSVRGGYRVSEAVLHTLALLGGTPAAAVGQILFRHKTRKRQFQIVFFSIMVFQAAVLTLFVLARKG